MESIDPTRILSHQDIREVITHLKSPRLARYRSNRQLLIVFRLSTCLGLRASEIGDLKLSHVRLTKRLPSLRVTGKGNKTRTVPLWWDGETLDDLQRWVAERKLEAAKGGDFVLTTNRGSRIDRSNIRKKFIRACKPLGRDVTTHDGRHTFCSLALAGGKTLPQVRDAAGHSSIGVTNIYLHAIDDGTVGNLFSVAE